MTDNQRKEKLEAFFKNKSPWQSNLKQLRELALTLEVEETYKWQFPTYSYQGKNVFSLASFKKWYGLWFFNGSAMNDYLQVLSNAQEGKTKHMRHWKFFENGKLPKNDILTYMQDSIDAQATGVIEVEKKQTPIAKPRIPMPKELKHWLDQNPKLKKNYEDLTPAQKRAYREYIVEAKREATKISRIEKMKPYLAKGLPLSALWTN